MKVPNEDIILMLPKKISNLLVSLARSLLDKGYDLFKVAFGRKNLFEELILLDS
jgi:hypothetical protein